jgi:uncharacterized protein (TIGR02246 family)
MGLVTIVVVTAAFAQDKSPPAAARRDSATSPNPAASGDEQAIRATGDAFIKAFNAADAKTLGALWTAEADYVDENGQSYQGRAAIEKEYATLFDEHPGVTMRIEILSVHVIGPATAVEDGRSSNGRTISQGRYTAVHVKQDGKWLISAVRDMTDGETTESDIRVLNFLVGHWTSERDDAKVKTSCQWTAGKRFLLRTYTVTDTNNDTPRSSGLQVIGWDPASRQIRSWTFDSTGGHGQGLWNQVNGGWAIESEGVLADGTPTASTDLIEKVDARVIGWQSVNRTAGGQQLPDTEQVVLERVEQGS